MPSAKLVPLRITDSAGMAFTVPACHALEYAIANGIRVSNNSYSTDVDDQDYYDCVQAALASAQEPGQPGHIMVASAGNEGLDIDNFPKYPASFPFANIITVAATNNRDQLASENCGIGCPCNIASNFGAGSVDLGAPGGGPACLRSRNKSAGPPDVGGDWPHNVLQRAGRGNER
jgi:hypothetical protein